MKRRQLLLLAIFGRGCTVRQRFFRRTSRGGEQLMSSRWGVCFLEISTVLLGPRSSLALWSSHREASGSRIYSDCPLQILQWMYFLMTHAGLTRDSDRCNYDENYRVILNHGLAPADMAFLMLDPDPRTRITTRQMVALCNVEDIDSAANFYKSIILRSCASCRCATQYRNSNIPLHSVYKAYVELPSHAPTPEMALRCNFPSWEGSKTLWLKSHMWW